MNDLNFQNILALLDKCEIISVHQENFFKNTIETEITQSINGDDTSNNAT